MVIGMKYGRTRLDDPEAEDKTYPVANVFMTEFLRRNHSLNCTDLIGYNLSDRHALVLAREKTISHETNKVRRGCRGDHGDHSLILLNKTSLKSAKLCP